MKKLGILALVLVLVLAFAVPAGVLAAEEPATDTLPDTGITPDSPFYFLDKWSKQISLAFTFNAVNKVQKALGYAEERLAEAEAMAARNKFQAMEIAASQYSYYLTVATHNMEKAMNRGVDTSGQVADVTSKHLAYINQYQYANQQDGTPCEGCDQIRQQMRERAVTCQEDTIAALSLLNPEGALQLGTQLMEQAANRLQNMAGQADSGQIEEALQQCERYRTMNQQTAQECLTNQECLMEQIRNQYQLQDGSGGGSPNQNQQQGNTTTDTVTGTTVSGSGPMGPAPNSGDCTPDGSGFDGPNGPNSNGKS